MSSKPVGGKEKKIAHSPMEDVKLPNQTDSLGDWTVGMIKQIAEESESQVLVQSLNKAVDDFFPVKELRSFVNKRLVDYDNSGKKIAGQVHQRVSLVVGQSHSIAKNFYDGQLIAFEDALVDFYNELFASDESKGARACAQGTGVIHVLVLNDFWSKIGNSLHKSFQIVAATSFVPLNDSCFIIYIGVRHSNSVWPHHIQEDAKKGTTKVNN
jgi:hypothetical protein